MEGECNEQGEDEKCIPGFPKSEVRRPFGRHVRIVLKFKTLGGRVSSPFIWPMQCTPSRVIRRMKHVIPSV
jgi:hypothetical protein